MKTNKELKEEILDILNTIEVSYDCGMVLYSISKEEFSQVFKSKVEILLESSKPATNKLITILELIKPLKKICVQLKSTIENLQMVNIHRIQKL